MMHTKFSSTQKKHQPHNAVNASTLSVETLPDNLQHNQQFHATSREIID